MVAGFLCAWRALETRRGRVWLTCTSGLWALCIHVLLNTSPKVSCCLFCRKHNETLNAYQVNASVVYPENLELGHLKCCAYEGIISRLKVKVMAVCDADGEREEEMQRSSVTTGGARASLMHAGRVSIIHGTRQTVAASGESDLILRLF